MHASSPIERVVNPEDFEQRAEWSTAGAPFQKKEISWEHVAVAPIVLRLTCSADTSLVYFTYESRTHRSETKNCGSL